MKKLSLALAAILTASTWGAGQIDVGDGITASGAGVDLDGKVLQNAGSASQNDDLVTKAELDAATPARGAENIELVAAQTTITPAENLPQINLFGSPAALPGDVDSLARYNTDLDLDFGGDVTVALEAGSPVIMGGALDLRAANQTSLDVAAVSYDRPANNDSGNTFAFRMVFTPNYSSPLNALSTPGGTAIVTYFKMTGTSGTNNNVLIRHARTSSDQLQVFWYNNVGTARFSGSYAWNAVAGQQYELEFNVDAGSTDDASVWLDGVEVMSSGSVINLQNAPQVGSRIIFGGMDSSDPFESPSFSNFTVQEWALFDTVQRANGSGNYTPVGVPGTGISVEAIDSIVADGYAEGDTLRLNLLEPTRYYFARNSPAMANQIDLDADFYGSSTRSWLTLRKVGDHWSGETERPEVVNGFVRVTAATYDSTPEARVIHGDTTSNAVEIDLESCGPATDGVFKRIRRVEDSNDLVVDPAGSENIEGASASYSFNSEVVSGVTIRCVGAGPDLGWWIH